MKLLGISAVQLDDEQLAQIRCLAESHAYQVVLLNEQPELLPECELLFGSFRPDQIRKAVKLRWLQASMAGVEQLCEPSLYSNSDAILTNSSGAFGVAIAEYLLTAVLMLQRRMPFYIQGQMAHRWERAPGGIGTIDGSCVTVVGFGDLGRAFAQRIHSLGATVKAVKRTPGECPTYVTQVYTTEHLREAVADADIVALCLPLTPQTDGLFSQELIAAMKPGALLLNAGRGKTLDQSSLSEALRTGQLGGAAIDVAEQEPIPADDPIWELPNLIITPHISGSGLDWQNQRLIAALYLDNLRRWFSGIPLNHVVDRTRGY